MLDLRVAGNACTTGTSSVGLAEPTADRLGEVWPKVQPKLLRLLEKRGLTKPQAEDVCQDVAVRALASDVEFENAEDLYRWAGQVARNLHIDLLRSVSRIACDDSVLVDMQADTDVEHEVERRIALSKVLKHWLTLRPLDQAALLDGMYADGNEDRGEAVKLAVRRHRARQRLRVLAEGVFGWSGITFAIRRIRNVTSATPAAALAAVPVAFLIAAPTLSPGAGDGAQVVPDRSPRMAQLVGTRQEVGREADRVAPLAPAAKTPKTKVGRTDADKAMVDTGVAGARAKVDNNGRQSGEPSGGFSCTTLTGTVNQTVCVTVPEPSEQPPSS